MHILAIVTSASTLPAIIYAIIATIVLVAGGWGAIRLAKGATIKSITETAAADVARLKDLNDVLRQQVADDTRRINALEGQVETLRQMVTQAAKVEELRALVQTNHRETMISLGTLQERRSNDRPNEH